MIGLAVVVLSVSSAFAEEFELPKFDPSFSWSNPCTSSQVSSLPYCDPTLSIEERAYDLIYNRLTTEQLAAMSINSAS